MKSKSKPRHKPPTAYTPTAALYEGGIKFTKTKKFGKPPRKVVDNPYDISPVNIV